LLISSSSNKSAFFNQTIELWDLFSSRAIFSSELELEGYLLLHINWGELLFLLCNSLNLSFSKGVCGFESENKGSLYIGVSERGSKGLSFQSSSTLIKLSSGPSPSFWGEFLDEKKFSFSSKEGKVSTKNLKWDLGELLIPLF